MTAKSTVSSWETIGLFFNTINHCFIAICASYLTWYCFHVGFSGSHTWHAFLSATGYQVLMAEGILAMYKRNSFTYHVKTRAEKTTIHWIMMAGGGILALSGAILEITNVQLSGKEHFTQIHTQVGKLLKMFTHH